MTNDAEQAVRVADKLDAGMVYVNIVGADGAELPFGGVKRSGFGRELGRFGADEFRQQEADPYRRLVLDPSGADPSNHGPSSHGAGLHAGRGVRRQGTQDAERNSATPDAST